MVHHDRPVRFRQECHHVDRGAYRGRGGRGDCQPLRLFADFGLVPCAAARHRARDLFLRALYRRGHIAADRRIDRRELERRLPRWRPARTGRLAGSLPFGGAARFGACAMGSYLARTRSRGDRRPADAGRTRAVPRLRAGAVSGDTAFHGLRRSVTWCRRAGGQSPWRGLFCRARVGLVALDGRLRTMAVSGRRLLCRLQLGDGPSRKGLAHFQAHLGVARIPLRGAGLWDGRLHCLCSVLLGRSVCRARTRRR